jgi:autotransporter-associated beta strand protein
MTKKIGSRAGWALVGFLCAADAAQAATGVWTNVSGGYWADSANWQDGYVPAGAPNVADFSALGSGEAVTITNNTGIGALLFAGTPGDEWTVQTENGAQMGFDQTPLTVGFTGGEIRVEGGTLTLLPGWYYARYGVVKSGSGGVRLVNTYNTDFKGETRLDGGRLILSNNAALVSSVVTFNATNSLLVLESDALVGGMRSAVATVPDVALNGHSLSIGGAERHAEWDGRLTGDGTLALVRGEVQTLTATQAYSGVTRLDNGTLQLGKAAGKTVAWWRFDDEADIGKDSGALGNRLIAAGSPTQWYVDDPVRGGVLALDNGAYLAGPGVDKEVAALPTGNAPFTVAFWLKPAADVTDAAGVFGWGAYYLNYRCNMLRLNNPTSSVPLLHTNWANNREVPSSTNLKDGNWHHVAVVYSGVKYSFYIDGVLSKEEGQTPALEVQAGNFTLGRVWSTSYYKGLVDDFVIADWALSMSDLSAVRLAGQMPAGAAYPTDNLLPAVAQVEVGFNGTLRLLGDQTVATLGGAGAAGGVVLSCGGTLTAAGGGGATSTVFQSAISGDGRFVKRGVDYTLTLGGGNSYTGATEVQEGTLALVHVGVPRPQAHYRFDDAGSLGKDSSGNGYDLSASSSPAFVASGRLGGAAGFSTTDKDMLVASVFPATFPTGNVSYSFAVWCNPSVGNLKGMPVYWGGASSSPNGSGNLFRFESATQILVSNFGNNSTVSAGFDLFADTLNGGWHHIASTYDGATRVRRVYIDGALKFSDTRSSDLIVANAFFWLGGAPYGTANYYDGLLDEVMIFDCSLSGAEVQSIVEQTAPPPAPVACYRFDDASDPGKDSGAYGYHLAPFGAAAVTSQGKRNGALNLASAYGYLAWTNSVFPEMMPTGNQAMTIAAWVNPKTGADADGTVVCWGKSSLAKGCHVLRLRSFASGRLGMSYTDASAPNLESDAVNGLDYGAHPEGWHHVAAVYGAGARALYVDGVLLAQDSRSGLIVTTNTLFVGRKDAPAEKWFQGLIDEVEIYNVALSQSQICEVLRGGTDILPAATVLAVEGGATFRLSGARQRISALSGGGEVSLSEGLGLGLLTVAGGTGVFEGSLTGAGGIAVRDGAVQTLAGAGAFVGAVTVSNATLLIENAGGSVTGDGSAVTVQAGGRLGGSGALAGDVTFESGAGVVAGAGPDGLTVSGTVTLGANGTVSVALPSGFSGGSIVLISATSLSAPAGLSGWTVSGVPASWQTALKQVGNTLTLGVFRRGTLISVQ